MARKFSAAQRLAALRLYRSDGVGPITYHQLLNFFKDPSEALEMLPELARRGGRRKKLRVATQNAAEKEIASLEKSGGEIIIYGDAIYPNELAAISDAPPILSAIGNKHLLKGAKIAFVGARNASAGALKITEKLAGGLGEHDYLIVSGMARGVDTAAHWQGLASGTIAVLAGGVDNIYPEENNDLYQRLTKEGLLISENPLGAKPQARHFPRRNRIISGLSLAVIVIEAALRSGSLITARLAAEQGREVMAVPGSPLDPRCRGTNNLLRQGAVLVENLDDMLGVLQSLKDRKVYEPEMPHEIDTRIQIDPSAAERERIISLLGSIPVGIDELIERADCAPSIVHLVLVELELAGRLTRDQIGISLIDAA